MRAAFGFLLLMVSYIVNAQPVLSPAGCHAPLDRCAIFLQPFKDDPLNAQPCAITNRELERTECILVDFLRERAQRGDAFRDSVFSTSRGAIRTEDLSRPLSEYYRQYVASCAGSGDTLIYLNAFCGLDADVDRAIYEYLVMDYKKNHPVINAEGDTLAEFRTFLASQDGLRPGAWRRHWLSADDGGDRFFQVLFNLNKKAVVRFSVNGPYLYERK